MRHLANFLRIRRGHPGTTDKLMILPPDTPTIDLGVRRGPLPVEAQVLLRVIGEDLPGAKELIKSMPELDRGIFLFYIEQVGGLIYEVDQAEF